MFIMKFIAMAPGQAEGMAMKGYSVKRLCSFCGFLAAAAISPTQAAELGYAAVEMPGTWTGFNIGTGVSAGGSRTQVRGPSGTNFTMLDGEGLGPFMPWVTAGYDIQFGSFVAGIAANPAYDEAKERHIDSVLGSIKIYTQDFGSLQLRGGYVFGNVLLYGTAGFEFAKINVTGDLLRIDYRKLNFGPVAGIGADYAVDRSRILLLRAEAKVYGLSEKNLDFTAGAGKANESVAIISFGFVRKY
jgi:outer membrane immunogenic protein